MTSNPEVEPRENQAVQKSACGKRWSRLEPKLLGRAAWRPRHRFLITHKGDESVFHFPTSIFHPFSISGTSKTLKKPPFPAFLKFIANLAKV